MYCSTLSCFQRIPCLLHKEGTVCVGVPQDAILQTTKAHTFSLNLGEDTIEVSLRLKQESKDGELWASLWGSSAVAAEALMGNGKAGLANLSVLEIGCGAGLVSVGAVLGGASEVTVTDCVAEALPLACANVKQAASPGTVISSRVLNFNNDCPAEFVGKFDVVCGADVLYIGRVVSSVLNLAWTALKPGGVLLIVDPGRGYTEDLVTRAEDKGYEVPVYQELRGVPTAVCCMGACVVVMCKKPTHGEPSNGTLVALEASVQRRCVKLAASGQKGTRMDYIFRPDSANKH